MTRRFDVTETALDPGILLLEASAGTGKTWSLTSIAVRLVLEQRVESIDRMLLVTFTVKATDELRQRLRARLYETECVLNGSAEPGDPFLLWVRERWARDGAARRNLIRARRDVDLARVRTIHGFCQELLAEGAFEAGTPLDGGTQLEGDEVLKTAWRDAIRAAALANVPFLCAALAELGITADRTRELEVARRRLHDEWRPASPPPTQAATDLLRALDDLGCDRLGRFVVEGVRKDWKTADRNDCLRAFELLSAGFDSGRADHQEAVFQLSPDRVRGSLNQSGLRRFEESGLEERLAPVGAAIERLQISLRQGLYRDALERYVSLKQREGLVDFDDLISRTRARLQDPVTGPSLAARVGARYDVALVDEFQDTDADQWEVFRRLFTNPGAGHLLVLVADPKQAIYRFRGADIYAYLRAREAADRVETLTDNFRSTPELVESVNAVFGATPDESFAMAEIEFEPVRPAREPDPGSAMQVVWIDVPARTSQAATEEWVLRQLAADVVARRRQVRPGKGHAVAVLVGRHRQARAVRAALRSVGVDAVVAQSGDIHDSVAMGEWRVVLRALLDPSNLRLQRRARATRLWGTPQSGLAEGEHALAEVELLVDLHRRWVDEGVASMGGELIARRGTVLRWLGEDDGERMVTDLRHGLELLNRAEVQQGLGPEALLRWAEAQPGSFDPTDEERLLRLERESEAVQILTNFKSKGLEFDTVYLPYAWLPNRFAAEPPLEVHDPGTGGAVLDFVADPDLVPQAWLEEMASRLRMHYVELTRARERCVVYLAPVQKCFPHAAAAFLLARDGKPAPADRGEWVRDTVGEISGAIGEAFDRVRRRLEPTPIVLHEADGDHAEQDVERGPETHLPRALDFPPGRIAALRPWRQLSYTAIVRALQDHEATGTPVLADRSDPADAPARSRGTGIFGFARGARAGICLHELLEHSDFDRPVSPEDRDRVERLLVRHALELPTSHPGAIDPASACLALVEQVRRERLPFGTARFGSLGRSARLDEWQFNLPVSDFVPARIADLVREHWAGEEWIAGAADRMDRLSATKLHGMLGGFVDLLFVDGERWTVLDWKSNDLGPDPSCYTRAAMQRAMIEHDYVVQLLLYLVAVHRFLRTRVAAYDYDRHVAGASYAFLRGLCGDPESGWCNLSPPRSLVEAIDESFAGGRP